MSDSPPVVADPNVGCGPSARHRPSVGSWLRDRYGSIHAREVVAVLVWTIAADVLLFRTATYLSAGAFFLLTPIVYRCATVPARRDVSNAVCGWLMGLVVLRLWWLGSPLVVASGLVLVIALSMATHRVRPHVVAGFRWTVMSIVGGLGRIGQIRLPRTMMAMLRRQRILSATLIPIAVASAFATLFVLANPDWVERLLSSAKVLGTWVRVQLQDFSPLEIPFVIAAMIIGWGLMRPAWIRLAETASDSPAKATAIESPMYATYRNTLLVLIALFAVYLTNEYLTLFRRDFPSGFYYAGYAHQGAAWLTVALALATAVLSFIFGRSLMFDPRRIRVRRLAWLWSIQNLLLAVAVFNRLGIYVGYNGLTRMRMVAFFGVALVTVGFILVIVKIARDRPFDWLVRQQLVALIVTCILFSVTPIDAITTAYNSSRVTRMDLPPSVMLAVKPLDDEGLLWATALADHPNPIIRDGIRARLAERYRRFSEVPRSGLWNHQQASSLLQRTLQSHPTWWQSMMNMERRENADQRFRRYAMQWY